MGFFRGSSLVVLCILLFFSMLTLNSFLTLSSSLSYNNVQDQVVPLIINISEGNSALFQNFADGNFNLSLATDQVINQINQYCLTNTEFVFNYQGSTITIPCDATNGGREEIIQTAAESFVENAYYKNYNCDFWNWAPFLNL